MVKQYQPQASQTSVIVQGRGELPNSVLAEMSLIGIVLNRPAAMDEVLSVISVQSFYPERHQLIFAAILDLYRRNESIDIISVSDELTRRDVSIEDQVGGFAYLHKLSTAYYENPSFDRNLTKHATIVAEYALMRDGMMACSESMADFRTENPKDALAQTVERFMRLGEINTRNDFTFVSSFALERVEEIDVRRKSGNTIVGLSTGFPDLNKMLLGLQRQKLYLLAARPGQGKTSMALTLAYHAAVKCGLTVGFLSLEMSKEELLDRLAAMDAHIDGQKITSGQLDDAEWERYIASMGRLSTAKIAIDDTFGCTLLDLKSKARRLQAKHGLDILFVDYLQIMSGENEHDVNELKILSEISRGLKGLARELDIPVFALAQLSREVEKRQVKVPQLPDLRGSGTLEQDADVVMFLYRDEYYNPGTERPGQTDLIVAKQRGGKTGSVVMGFAAAETRFFPLELTLMTPDDEG